MAPPQDGTPEAVRPCMDADERTASQEETSALMSNIYLPKNGDLYVGDGYDLENIEQFLQVLRAYGFLREDVETIHINLS